MRRPWRRQPCGPPPALSAEQPSGDPALVTAKGSRTEERFWEFFGVTIRNRHTRHTRLAYLQAGTGFCAATEAHGITRLIEVRPLHVAAYVEALGRSHAIATVKQHLAALRRLFDWLVAGLPVEPAPPRPISVSGHPERILPLLRPDEKSLH
ncbi:hypothetical protein DDV93_12360 [Cereibacter johrii]|nr:hypothetical protein DDV93_12360 [Cereibacter johrii]